MYDVPVELDVLHIKLAAATGQPSNAKLAARIDKAIDTVLTYIKEGDEPDIDHNDLFAIIYGAKYNGRIERVDKFLFSMKEAFGGDHFATDITIDNVNLTVKWFQYMNYEKEAQRLKEGVKEKKIDGEYYDTVEDFYSWTYAG